jgi:Uma2 family endonuclease
MSIAQAKRFTLDEYHRLGELGFFHEDDHIELINGEIIQMASKGKAHETCLRNLWKQLPKIVGDRATLQSQAPITLPPNSEPEPDFAIVQNRDDNYLSAHPKATDVLLVMEVSDSSLAYDHSNKRIVLSTQVINFPCFPDLSLDLARVFPPKLNF